MREPQDVRLDLPDGTVVRPSETEHSVTETGQRWDYRFELPETMTRDVDFYDGPEDALQSVTLVPVNETEDNW